MNYINIIDIKISDYEQVICMISDSWYALHGHRTSGGVKPPRGPVAGRALWLEVIKTLETAMEAIHLSGRNFLKVSIRRFERFNVSSFQRTHIFQNWKPRRYSVAGCRQNSHNGIGTWKFSQLLSRRHAVSIRQGMYLAKQDGHTGFDGINEK